MGTGFAGRSLAPDSCALLLRVTLCSSLRPLCPCEGGGRGEKITGRATRIGRFWVVLNMVHLGVSWHGQCLLCYSYFHVFPKCLTVFVCYFHNNKGHTQKTHYSSVGSLPPSEVLKDTLANTNEPTPNHTKGILSQETCL